MRKNKKQLTASEAEVLKELLRKMNEEVPMSVGTDKFGFWVIISHSIGWIIWKHMHDEQQAEMLDWCAQTFKAKSYYLDYDTWCFHFVEEADRTAFMIRWGK